MTKVKICGIKTLEEATFISRSGAWAIGQVFAPSRRRIEVDRAAAINRELGGGVLKVGVFVNEALDTIKQIITTCDLDMVQLHGEESPEFLSEITVPVIKSFSVNDYVDPDYVKRWRPWAYLFDTAVQEQWGGSGISFNWDYLQTVRDWPNLILAGGLKAGNVGAAIQRIKPLAVDVSSGVEYPAGGKDPQAIESFMDEVKEADKYVTG